MKFAFSFIGRSLTDRYQYMKDLLGKQAEYETKKKVNPSLQPPFCSSPYILDFQKELQFWFRAERTVRFALRRLVTVWLHKRYKGRILNTVDPATLEAPIQEICVFDARARGTYRFEASTLRRQWDENLGYAKWMVPEPQLPKNPLTNLPFHHGQLVAILQGFRAFGKSSWLIEGFVEANFQRNQFLEKFRQTLRLQTLEMCYKDPKHEDTIDFMEEFIEDEFEFHDIEFRAHLVILKWGLRHAMDTKYMKQWLQTWYDYYKLFILNGPTVLRYNPALLNAIHDETEDLFRNAKAIAFLARKRLDAHLPRLQQSLRALPSLPAPTPAPLPARTIFRVRIQLPQTPAERLLIEDQEIPSRNVRHRSEPRNEFVQAVEELVRHEPSQDP